ncbi:MAG: Na(+)-translocating NADH-quinone reductase subunit A [Bacteriovoracaceae bacterium]|jgi:Na+-transporting NADH:ubiquinone oxidoreductase subunit A|nr:NADH:ubiquinone reductase (Na(+)-transporting) subunit A [Halobacteriovoraceae bacterium]MDP7319750.1 Na(+)-translocating NADH-quinone reductase subunit A [Bacteriovoracaceae bacterium]
MIKLKKGLNLPIEGEPQQKIDDGPKVTRVALLGDDLVGMKPTMEVKVGDKVKKGQLLYSDKKTVGVKYTAPVAGEVLEINRGARRAFESLVIKVESEDHVSFESYKGSDLSQYNSQDVRDLLIESGQWTALRRRPFSKVAKPDETPSSIFVTAIDTHPLSPDPALIIKNNEEAFAKGIKVLKKLCEKVFLCTAQGSTVQPQEGVTKKEFSGPHPAGLVGTHIHFLDPVGEKKFVWHIGYQDVIALGKLIENGEIFTDRVIALAGPAAKNPRLLKTRMGAAINELCKDEVKFDKVRYISGSVFGGRNAKDSFGYLGRFHNQVSLLAEGGHRELLGWHSPGFDKFSVKPIYLSKLFSKKFAFDTDTNGSLRSIVPIGSYEKVMPLDILPTFLTRALMSGNTDMCVKLGALELDEEDLSLCTFVDPCKNDFAIKLRENLTEIEKEG